jgi:hypothetical protein
MVSNEITPHQGVFNVRLVGFVLPYDDGAHDARDVIVVDVWVLY